tara:strand:- start:211 stop:414 length:204 start_codon:yes stop_codon:yes gene_type:complete
MKKSELKQLIREELDSLNKGGNLATIGGGDIDGIVEINLTVEDLGKLETNGELQGPNYYITLRYKQG